VISNFFPFFTYTLFQPNIYFLRCSICSLYLEKKTNKQKATKQFSLTSRKICSSLQPHNKLTNWSWEGQEKAKQKVKDEKI